MHTTPDFSTLATHAAQSLRALADQVAEISPVALRSWSFNTDQLDLNSASAPMHRAALGTDRRCWNVDARAIPSETESLPLLAEIDHWATAGAPYLYCFRLRSAGNPDFARAFQAYRQTKARACARHNGDAGEVLYIGSSRDLAKRLREHLGYGHAQTYALQLSHWARGLNLDIEILCAEYSAEMLPSWVQALEDCAWEEAQPVFGRRGSK